MKLYEITNEYAEILNNLYDEEGNVQQQELAKLESTQLAMEKKAIAIASFIKNLEAEAEAIKNAKTAMADREKRLKKKAEDMENYLQFNMEACGITNIKCPYFEIALKKCRPSVDDSTLDMAALPDEYKRIKIEPDKAKMLAEMKQGVIIPGASLKQGMTLTIK